MRNIARIGEVVEAHYETGCTTYLFGRRESRRSSPCAPSLKSCRSRRSYRTPRSSDVLQTAKKPPARVARWPAPILPACPAPRRPGLAGALSLSSKSAPGCTQVGWGGHWLILSTAYCAAGWRSSLLFHLRVHVLSSSRVLRFIITKSQRASSRVKELHHTSLMYLCDEEKIYYYTHFCPPYHPYVLSIYCLQRYVYNFCMHLNLQFQTAFHYGSHSIWLSRFAFYAYVIS